jgi:hypothetical protein
MIIVAEYSAENRLPLKIGDRVLNANGEMVTIVAIRKEEASGIIIVARDSENNGYQTLQTSGAA